jgi:hypothetical protein
MLIRQGLLLLYCYAQLTVQVFAVKLRYPDIIEAAERSGLSANRMDYITGRFLRELEYHSNRSRKSKLHYFLLAILGLSVPLAGSLVMFVSATLPNEHAKNGLVVSAIILYTALFIAALSKLLDSNNTWTASRQLVQELKAQFWQMIGEQGFVPDDDRWFGFYSDVESLLKEEIKSFSMQAKISEVAVKREMRRNIDALSAVVPGMQHHAPEQAPVSEQDDRARWQSEQLASGSEDSDSYTQFTQANP